MPFALPSCAIDAPAKINLTLEILGTRPDGYHAIRTLIVPTTLHDTLEIRALPAAADDRLEVVADGVPIDRVGPAADNLCLRAVRLLRERLGFPGRVAIRLVKRIPIGGGLGGGSSDGAAALAGLHTMLGSPLPREELFGLAARLGSDVPALLHGGAVLCEGRGEILTPVDAAHGFAPTPPAHLVLANPGIHVSTPAAFRAVKGELTSPAISATILHSPPSLGGFLSPDVELFNGLEGPVFALHPEVGRLAHRMREAGAGTVLMSGSGASVFALAASESDAAKIRQAIPATFWRMVTRTVPDGVMAAHGPLEP